MGYYTDQMALHIGTVILHGGAVKNGAGTWMGIPIVIMVHVITWVNGILTASLLNDDTEYRWIRRT